MNTPPDAKTPSPVTQAAVTVALSIYLVGLVLSIVGNTGSGSSAVVRTIKSRLFSPWMVPPWLDLGFDYRLTYGSDEDGDFSVEVRRQGDGKAAPVRLPGRLTGERAARWRRAGRPWDQTMPAGRRHSSTRAQARWLRRRSARSPAAGCRRH